MGSAVGFLPVILWMMFAWWSEFFNYPASLVTRNRPSRQEVRCHPVMYVHSFLMVLGACLNDVLPSAYLHWTKKNVLSATWLKKICSSRLFASFKSLWDIDWSMMVQPLEELLFSSIASIPSRMSKDFDTRKGWSLIIANWLRNIHTIFVTASEKNLLLLALLAAFG